MSITGLAPELILQVLDLVDPPTLVSLACSCSFFNGCTRDLLRKHQNANREYRVVTDAHPWSLTNILRKVAADPGLAWHVRDLEFASARMEWSQWGDTETEAVEVSGTTGPPDDTFSQDEQMAYLDQLREIFYFSEHEIDEAREDLQHGNDAPLKLLLSGCCPRLRSVKFARRFHISGLGTLERGSADDLYDVPRSSLVYFLKAMINHFQSGRPAWPMGLASLQDLAIGVDTGNEVGNLSSDPTPFQVTALMELPHLTSLYCFGLNTDATEQSGTDAGYKLNSGSSSVRHIFLENASGIAKAPIEAILSGCKHLKSLTISNSDMGNVDTLVEILKDRHRKSLETLMFYKTDNLGGYRRAMFETEALGRLSSLRMLYIDCRDLLEDAAWQYRQDVKGGEGHDWSVDVDFFVDFCMTSALPDDMEVLVLGTRMASHMSEKDAELLDRAITKLIECGAANYCAEKKSDVCRCGRHKLPKYIPGSLPNLIKAVYLDSLDEIQYHDYHHKQRRRDKRWFSSAIAAGRKHGVDVHTRTTRSLPFHQIDFPKPPVITSHMSASPSAENPLVFDIYTGRWGLPKCGNCGRCEECLDQYDISVWKEIEIELERGISSE